MEKNKIEKEEISKKDNENDISLDSNLNNSRKKDNKNKKIIILIILIILILLVLVFAIYKVYFTKSEKPTVTKTKAKEVYSKYRMPSNELSDFDLRFLQLENKNQNMLYSPLSIKYALAMLSEGAKGESKSQIDSIIGKYKSNKYINSSNMSFANAMFIRNSYKEQIKDTYTSSLQNKYNAEVIYDSFENTNNLNSWVNDKTFGLINNLFQDISELEYILVNALAIDMEWNKLIQAEPSSGYYYHVNYDHEKYNEIIYPLRDYDHPTVLFNNNLNAKSVEIGASINNYDIVKELGEENIRKTVSEGYQDWLNNEGKYDSCHIDDMNVFLDNYIKEINANYKKVESSTDFLFHNDDDIKVFAKDLKEYNGTTLQYIGIMPKKIELADYINKISAKEINKVINKLKTIELDNFEYGKVYKIVGNIPLFKFDYELDLQTDLENMGIKNVFNKDKADLSNLSKDKGAYIGKTAHKANIEFSNHGIKAAAITVEGGLGSITCGYDYLYDVPIETIDMTFDKPYIFLIRDKNTNEVWFSGSVYQPTAK